MVDRTPNGGTCKIQEAGYSSAVCITAVPGINSRLARVHRFTGKCSQAANGTTCVVVKGLPERW